MTEDAPQPSLVVGIGLGAEATASEVTELLRASLAEAGCRIADVAAFATIEARRCHVALVALAEA